MLPAGSRLRVVGSHVEGLGGGWITASFVLLSVETGPEAGTTVAIDDEAARWPRLRVGSAAAFIVPADT
jgi:hypothetical protein